MFAELVDLVLPSCCVMCHRPAPDQWCHSCRTTAEIQHWRLSGGLAVCASATYAGALRAAILAYKERGARRLAPALAQLLHTAVRSAESAGDSIDLQPTIVVPVPSTAAAAREPGGDHLLRLANALARCAHVKVESPLRIRRGVTESVGLSVDQRRANLLETMTARPPTGTSCIRQVLIIDDVCTTGATLIEANRALSQAGWQVCGAAVLARTVLRRRV